VPPVTLIRVPRTSDIMVCPQDKKGGLDNVVFVSAFELWRRKKSLVLVVDDKHSKGSAEASQTRSPEEKA
jgi:hypothetical protein